MADQNSNGAEGQGAGTPRFAVLAQYTKDLSFENPNAPRVLSQRRRARTSPFRSTSTRASSPPTTTK